MANKHPAMPAPIWASSAVETRSRLWHHSLVGDKLHTVTMYLGMPEHWKREP